MIELNDFWAKQTVNFIPEEIEMFRYNKMQVLKDEYIENCVKSVLKQVTGKLFITEEDFKKCQTFTWADKPGIIGMSYNNNALGTFTTELQDTRYIVRFTPL